MRRQEQKSNIFLLVKGALIALLLVYQTGAYAQEYSPADEYYKEHLGENSAPAEQVPSETYYNNNILRAGPPGGGPGGSGTGGNGGVGVAPIGDGTTCLIVSILGYMLIMAYRRHKQSKQTDLHIK